MTANAEKINAPSGPKPWTKPHNWGKASIDASIKPFAQGKVDRGLVPTNRVEPTWKDALDIINPLHQIPVVGDIYRGMTGEKISGLARVMGGFLYGGLTGGFAASFAAAYAQAHDDHSPGEQVVAMLFGDEKRETPLQPAEAPVRLASADLPLSSTQALLGHAGQVAEKGASPALIAALPANQTPAASGAPLTEKTEKQTELASLNGQSQASALVQPPAGAIKTASLVPLRERLNRKNGPQTIQASKPLNQFAAASQPKGSAVPRGNFVAEIPANAALLAAAQSQNLELLQGFAAQQPTAPAKESPATPPSQPIMSAAAPANGNPLPRQLIEDMMIMALDKYRTMKAGTGGMGLQ